MVRVAFPCRLKGLSEARTENRASDSLNSVTVGSILDSSSSKRLAVCPYFKMVLWNRRSSLDVVRRWNSCSLGSHHCSFRGKRYKFKPCFGGVRVVWICPNVAGLPNEEI